MLNQEPLLLISGPTAGGKSALAVSLAQALNGEVLSADSVHVYRGLDIGSGKILPAEMQGIPHHLLSVRDPDQPYNVAQFVREAEVCIEDMAARGRLCLVCGGTSLYVKSLLYGLADLPRADEATRRALGELSLEALHEQLQAHDPESALRLHRHDRMRMMRALEASRLTGVAASEIQRQHGYQSLRHRGLLLVLCWPRDVLYRRIEDRAEKMMEQGLVAETRILIEKYGSELGLFSTVGYEQVKEYLAGLCSLAELPGRIAMHTKRLAKQQMTFWRNEPKKRGWSVHPTEAESGELIGAEQDPRQSHNKLKGFRVYNHSLEELQNAVRQRWSEDFSGVEVWFLNGQALI